MRPRDRPRPHRLLHPAGAAGPVPPVGPRPSATPTPIPAIGRLGLWPIPGATLARRRPASLTITHIGRLCAYQPSGARCQLPAHIESLLFVNRFGGAGRDVVVVVMAAVLSARQPVLAGAAASFIVPAVRCAQASRS